MAVRFDASTDDLRRTTVLPSQTTCTLMAWFNWAVATAPGSVGAVVSIGVNTSGANFYSIGPSNFGGNLRLFLWNSVSNVMGTTPLVTDVWYHGTLTCAGTGANQLISYLDGVQSSTATAMGSITAARIMCGQSVGDDAFNGRIAAIKIYGAVLTADEIKAEMRAYVPVKTEGLLSWHPMLLHTDLAQYGATWTATGTLATEVGPPIPWSVRPPSFGRKALVILPYLWPSHTMTPTVQRAGYW